MLRLLLRLYLLAGASMDKAKQMFLNDYFKLCQQHGMYLESEDILFLATKKDWPDFDDDLSSTLKIFGFEEDEPDGKWKTLDPELDIIVNGEE
jgi:hypothetical protein